jgi:hypothetical protein
MRIAVDVRQPLAVFIGGLSGLAWLTPAVWGESPYARYLSHHSLAQLGSGGGGLPMAG